MHCDDKRTISALKQYILDATAQLQEFKEQIKQESDNKKKDQIQNYIVFLEKSIRDSKDQLSFMEKI